jgi:ATP-dependent phosphoenolpyruvate carboxykinase
VLASSNGACFIAKQLRRCFATKLEKLGLAQAWGINKPEIVYRNLSYPEIALHEAHYKEGHFISNGTLAVDTGIFTGRSPGDKWCTKQAPSESDIWWGKVNQPISPAVFDDLYNNSIEYMNKAGRLYVLDCYCGANKKTQKKIRFIHEKAWQHHFCTNMFIRPQSQEELDSFVPDFTIINSCGTSNPKWKEHKLNSDVYVAFNLEKKVAVIGGTYYGGENKKGVFSLMQYWLPKEGIMSMHCSANKGKDGDTALFFGLSGTGKTTLSADPNRYLIGDDEHGWDNEGIFNFEGGCYAKTINLKEENEPEIYRAVRPDALLENVVIKSDTNWPDYDDDSKTENGRVSYPLYHIPNYEPSGLGAHPKNCIFLACDAFGVLPPVARLSSEQAVYHFLSGYTAKVAGTERGVTEPEATFSAGFGAVFLMLHPTVYADLLKTKLDKHGTKAFLVNTGWSGGSYGVGKRMSIKATRACITGILDGSINNAKFVKDEIFGFEVPVALPGVPEGVLNPKDAWSDKAAYDKTVLKLAGLFKENFKKFVAAGKTDYTQFGPK